MKKARFIIPLIFFISYFSFTSPLFAGESGEEFEEIRHSSSTSAEESEETPLQTSENPSSGKKLTEIPVSFVNFEHRLANIDVATNIFSFISDLDEQHAALVCTAWYAAYYAAYTVYNSQLSFEKAKEALLEYLNERPYAKKSIPSIKALQLDKIPTQALVATLSMFQKHHKLFPLDDIREEGSPYSYLPERVQYTLDMMCSDVNSAITPYSWVVAHDNIENSDVENDVKDIDLVRYFSELSAQSRAKSIHLIGFFAPIKHFDSEKAKLLASGLAQSSYLIKLALSYVEFQDDPKALGEFIKGLCESKTLKTVILWLGGINETCADALIAAIPEGNTLPFRLCLPNMLVNTYDHVTHKNVIEVAGIRALEAVFGVEQGSDRLGFGLSPSAFIKDKSIREESEKIKEMLANHFGKIFEWNWDEEFGIRLARL